MEDDKILEQFLNELIKEKGGSRNDYHLLKDKIAWVESKGRADAIQESSGHRKGPGRGKYQFEMGLSEDSIKGSNRAKDARNRTIRMLKQYGMGIPQWLKDLRLEETFDASKLTDKQQDLLFFGDLRGNNRVNYQSLSTPEGIKNAWLDTHWVGNRASKDYKEQRKLKSEMWDKHQEEFKPTDYSKRLQILDGPDKSSLRGEYPTVKKDGLINMLSLANENNMDYRKRAYASAPSRGIMSNQNQKANGGPIDPPKGVKPNDFAIQYGRKGTRPNYDKNGNMTSESTHLMGSHISDEGNYVFPTLFQNEDGTWLDTNEEGYKGRSPFWEANRRGELYQFDTAEEAEKFSHGSWKPAYNRYAQGGPIQSQDNQSGLNEYATGGTHEQNPYGGIPQGMGANGKMNTVEEGETSHKFNGMKYIFSNRLKIK